MSGIYLYGIVEAKVEEFLAVPGVDGVSPVHVLAEHGLGCVVSDYHGEDFREMSKARLVRCLLAHEMVLEQLGQVRMVLPVKLGVLLDDCHDAIALLRHGRAELAEAMNSLCHKTEMEVVATWDVPTTLKEISLDKEVASLREAISGNGESPDRRDIIALGRLVESHMDRRRRDYRERAMGLLRPLALDAVSNALLSDGMVMNTAFLIERAREREFDEAVRRLDGLFHSDLTFRVIGPMPPYSFSTVEIMRWTPEDLEEAKGLLHLNGEIAQDRVRKAYRQQAAQAQRSADTHNGNLPSHLARLRHASELLLRHCQVSWQAENGSSHPNGHSFAVAIRRNDQEKIPASSFGGGDSGDPHA